MSFLPLYPFCRPIVLIGVLLECVRFCVMSGVTAGAAGPFACAAWRAWRAWARLCASLIAMGRGCWKYKAPVQTLPQPKTLPTTGLLPRRSHAPAQSEPSNSINNRDRLLSRRRVPWAKSTCASHFPRSATPSLALSSRFDLVLKLPMLIYVCKHTRWPRFPLHHHGSHRCLASTSIHSCEGFPASPVGRAIHVLPESKEDRGVRVASC